MFRTPDENTGNQQGYLRIKQKAFPKSKFPLHVSSSILSSKITLTFSNDYREKSFEKQQNVNSVIQATIIIYDNVTG